MRSIVQVAFAFAAAAGLAGVVHAGSTVGAATDTVTESSGGIQATAPDVAKTPSPGGPVPIPYPNMGGVKPDMEKKPVQSSKEVPLKNNSQFKQSTGDEAGTINGVSPTILLSPIDQYGTPPDAAARQTPKTDFGSVLGRGASKSADFALGKKTEKQPVAAPLVKVPVVGAPAVPVPVPAAPPVSVPQPVVVQPVQVQPITLQPQPVLRR